MKFRMTKEELVSNYEKRYKKIADRESKRLLKLYRKFVFWAWVHVHFSAFKGYTRLNIRLIPKYVEVFKSTPFSVQFREMLRNEFKTYSIEFSCENSEYKPWYYLYENITITWR